MAFRIEVFDDDSYTESVAARIAIDVPAGGSVILTGGTTAAEIYPRLRNQPVSWKDLDLFFSDERCVPPDHVESNYRMVCDRLFGDKRPENLNRMRGEEEPERESHRYAELIRPAVEGGIELALLGMGADAHIAAMSPGSPPVSERNRLCMSVERPDGMTGITLTTPALMSARRILLLVAGQEKAEAVRRVMAGGDPEHCPALLLEHHHDATFLLNRSAASALS